MINRFRKWRYIMITETFPNESIHFIQGDEGLFYSSGQNLMQTFKRPIPAWWGLFRNGVYSLRNGYINFTSKTLLRYNGTVSISVTKIRLPNCWFHLDGSPPSFKLGQTKVHSFGGESLNIAFKSFNLNKIFISISNWGSKEPSSIICFLYIHSGNIHEFVS